MDRIVVERKVGPQVNLVHLLETFFHPSPTCGLTTAQITLIKIPTIITREVKKTAAFTTTAQLWVPTELTNLLFKLGTAKTPLMTKSLSTAQVSTGFIQAIIGRTVPSRVRPNREIALERFPVPVACTQLRFKILSTEECTRCATQVAGQKVRVTIGTTQRRYDAKLHAGKTPKPKLNKHRSNAYIIKSGMVTL